MYVLSLLFYYIIIVVLLLFIYIVHLSSGPVGFGINTVQCSTNCIQLYISKIDNT